jgi:hypothetical protein
MDLLPLARGNELGGCSSIIRALFKGDGVREPPQLISSRPRPTSITSVCGSSGFGDEFALVIVLGVDDALLFNELIDFNAFNRFTGPVGDGLSITGDIG